MARSAYREAAASFDQALDALRHLPESRAADGAGHRPPPRRQRRPGGRSGESAKSTDMLARPRPSPRRWATSAGRGGPWPSSR